MRVPVLMAVRMRVGGAVRVRVAVFVPMRVVVSMLVAMAVISMFVCFGWAVGMTVDLPSCILMQMAVMALQAACMQFDRAVRMIVRLVKMKILDPLLALAAAAGTAHQTTSISLRRISSPP